MPASLYDSLITQLSLQIDKKTTLSKKFKSKEFYTVENMHVRVIKDGTAYIIEDNDALK